MITTLPTVEKTASVINGISLILKYQQSAEFSATSDRIYFGAYCGEKMTPEDLHLMDDFGWFEEYDSWATSV